MGRRSFAERIRALEALEQAATEEAEQAEMPLFELLQAMVAGIRTGAIWPLRRCGGFGFFSSEGDPVTRQYNRLLEAGQVPVLFGISHDEALRAAALLDAGALWASSPAESASSTWQLSPPQPTPGGIVYHPDYPLCVLVERSLRIYEELRTWYREMGAPEATMPVQVSTPAEVAALLREWIQHEWRPADGA